MIQSEVHIHIYIWAIAQQLSYFFNSINQLFYTLPDCSYLNIFHLNQLIAWKKGHNIKPSRSRSASFINSWMRLWSNNSIFNNMIIYTIYHTYTVSKKKHGFVYRGHFRGLNGLRSKSGRKQTPIKIQFYQLGGSPLHNLYKPCIHHVYLASERYILAVMTWQLYRTKYSTGS